MKNRFAIFATAFVLLFCVSCGNLQPNAKNDNKQKNDLPSGFFEVESKPLGSDRSIVIAKNQNQFVIVLEDASKKSIKTSIPFNAASVKLAQNRQWGCKLGDIQGYAVSFETSAEGFDGKFIKVFDKDLNEIKNNLGSGFVPRELEDINYDGNFDLIAIDARWENNKEFLGFQPYTQRICNLKNGIFVDDPKSYKEQFEAGKKAFMELMNKSQNQKEALYYAISLVLVFDNQGKTEEGIAGFGSMLDQFTQADVKKLANSVLLEFRKQNSDKEKLHPPSWNIRDSLAWRFLPFK